VSSQGRRAAAPPHIHHQSPYSGFARDGALEISFHEASSASSAPGHVRPQSIASFQAVNILRTAPHQPSTVSECSDKSVTPARID
jgi:hypothetical protein